MSRVDAEVHAFSTAVLRYLTARLAACPGEVNYEDGLVVLAEEGQCSTARWMIGKGLEHILFMNLLQRGREPVPPATQQPIRRLQSLFSLCKRLPQSLLPVEHLGRRADDDGVETLEREAVCLLTGPGRWVINPIVI